MSCTWCGEDHPAYKHGPLRRKLYWWKERFPFRPPGPDNWVTITLTDEEQEAARHRADVVVTEDIKRKWKMYFTPGGGESRMDVNVRGFGAEIAAHHATGLPLNWDYLPEDYERKQKPADLSRRVEVRNARSKTGSLVAHEGDPIKRVFLLVTGTMPTFTVRGWVEGRDLKIEERWLEPPEVRYPGYFAEMDEVNPLPLPKGV